MNHALAGVDLLIGIDDTDNLRSPGTGRRARALLGELATAGLGTPAGATRHQLLLDDQIPYTTHNSSACLAWRSRDGNPEQVKRDVIAVAARFLSGSAHRTPIPASRSPSRAGSPMRCHRSSTSAAGQSGKCCTPTKPVNSPQHSACIYPDTGAPRTAFWARWPRWGCTCRAMTDCSSPCPGWSNCPVKPPSTSCARGYPSTRSATARIAGPAPASPSSLATGSIRCLSTARPCCCSNRPRVNRAVAGDGGPRRAGSSDNTDHRPARTGGHPGIGDSDVAFRCEFLVAGPPARGCGRRGLEGDRRRQ